MCDRFGKLEERIIYVRFIKLDSAAWRVSGQVAITRKGVILSP